VETESVTLVDEEVVLFPDAPGEIYPGFAEVLYTGCSVGLKVFAFNCEVNEKEITLKDRIRVIL